MYTLVWTPAFARAAEKFVQRYPDLRMKLAAVLRDLESDPFQPHLKYHSLRGRLKGFQAVSVTYSHRIILTIESTEQEIVLLDIGSHDEVYR
ncbi:type II toxin-antitoxin system YafQ family toxin [Candidatus Thiosymbion oneisti]|uniref:type II toxin-antitoxin system RelE/ParE family toxin n=1 Tax=Candidatus Thiosymbion oneisti TaxID=589554 RepID=UPI000AF18330|nr:type II toxin-antitoxin system mRNA interferase toxin, RelE/StbE family [Candidatus Thiosymbion oneisti]